LLGPANQLVEYREVRASKRRVLDFAGGFAAVMVLAAFLYRDSLRAAWHARRPAPAAVSGAAADSAPKAAVAAALRLHSADSASPPSDTSARAPGDSTAWDLPHPRQLVGVWHHGDLQSKYGDSLSLVLRADGKVSARNRHYALTNTVGWRLTRSRREGTWAVSVDRRGDAELCLNWTRPGPALRACDELLLEGDSALTMEYGGRYWRKAVAPAPAKSRRPRTRGAR
jgi:hypothetical protein